LNGTVVMRTEDFNYHLPGHLIAQHALRQRDACRLLVLGRRSGAVAHRAFSDLTDLVRPNDLLVFNDTRVLPARLFCRKESGGRVELLLTARIDRRSWKALAKPGRRVRKGCKLFIRGDADAAVLTVEGVTPAGERIVRLAEGSAFSSIDEVMERCGSMPLPPYIRRDAGDSDRRDYQTVYALHGGAVAAPTAGLHFTAELLDALRKRGATLAFLTLHVGAGTFLPVKVSDPREHVMHEEEYELPEEVAAAVVRAKRTGGRIIAVGTTVVRVLEHCVALDGGLHASGGRTALKILPPYDFRIVDGLVTNFHLPRSTLLMLVCAFASREHVLAAYAEAVREQYRFFSYGDAMFIC
jgi:S-adenosylmethionine:tRNA ribosyltransferase-isomerase